MELSVEIAQGQLVGRERKGAALFAGIPFAAPPVGELRFAAPQPHQGWTGQRSATKFGRACPQLPGEGLTSSAIIPWDEDSLFVNVVTPDTSGSRPVLFWIHGGDYRHGTGATPWYDGSSFATRGDVVVVTTNYRMGAFGFARLDDHGDADAMSGINGLLDQVAALEWVRDNIAAFGGDPARVTIAGESAGAFSVGSLLAMPAAAGLFHGAILQSGAGHHVRAQQDAAAVAQALLDDLGAADIDDLRAREPLAILEAQQRIEANPPTEVEQVGSPFYPSMHTSQLPQRPIDLMADGRSADVPVLIGTNADETALWGLSSVPDDKLVRLMGKYADDPQAMVDVYRQAMPHASAGELAIALSSDWTFRIPAIRFAEQRAAHDANTWMYSFTWKSRAFGGALGACHALEIPFAFNSLDAAGIDVFLGDGPLPTELALTMHDVWINFAHNQNPQTDALEPWGTYDPGADRLVMEFGDSCGMLANPGAAEREAWAGLR